MQITKKEIMQKLYEIEEQNKIPVGRLIQKIVRNEIIPIEVIKIINKYDKDFLQIYNTYNVIYTSRNKNPLYRNLRNKNLSVEETAIAISSLVTKVLISCSKIEDINERMLFAQAMNIENLNEALTQYSIYNKSDDLLKCAQEIRDLLKILYSD